MVGYHSTGAYKLYDPNNKKIVFSKDVKFDESKCWHWKDKASDKNAINVYLSDSESEADETEAEEQIENVETIHEGGAKRPTRYIQPPARLNDYERFPDSTTNDEGDMVQLAMLTEAEPLSFEVALRQKHWKEAMIDELKSIEKMELGN